MLVIDQWQEEHIDQGHRIKFLAYPRQPIQGIRTRLVFEMQAVETGRYVGELSVQLQIQAPDGTEQTIPLPETTAVAPLAKPVMGNKRRLQNLESSPPRFFTTQRGKPAGAG